MRCIYCQASAGLMRRVCSTCAKVAAIVERHGASVGPAGLVDLFKAEGLTREQVNRVLDAQIGSAPTIRDRMTADMTNALMRGLGMPGRQSPDDVRRVRMAMQAGDESASASGESRGSE
jgi:hypothetical protein